MNGKDKGKEVEEWKGTKVRRWRNGREKGEIERRECKRGKPQTLHWLCDMSGAMGEKASRNVFFFNYSTSFTENDHFCYTFITGFPRNMWALCARGWENLRGL